REVKVQEKVRTCMKAQGFDYVPIDPSQSGMTVRVGGPDRGPENDDPEFRRTKGYGITTGFHDRPATAEQARDPNQAIRDRLSDADKEADDRALFGKAAEQMTTNGGERGFVVAAPAPGGAGGAGGPERANPADEGCFGTAQREVPGGPATLGNSLEELRKRIES